MSEARLRLIAASGLVVGAVLGMAGTFAGSASLRGLAWGLDGTALIVATALLTVHHLRRGNDLLAAGYLVFVAGETLILSGAAMDLAATGPLFAAGAGLWAASLALVSASRAMPVLVRWVGFVASLFVHRRSSTDVPGARLDATIPAAAVLRVSVSGCHFIWLGMGALPGVPINQSPALKSARAAGWREGHEEHATLPRRGRVMRTAADRRRTLLASLVILVLSITAQARRQAPAPPSAETRGQREALLSNGRIVPDASTAGTPSWRASLDDGSRKHDASIDTGDGTGPTGRNHRFNVAAYELDKLLQLDLVATSIERVVRGRPASITWWVDDFAMSEQDRRRKGIEPPDPDRWRRQVDAVRVFDELISNTYRDPSPGLYLNSVWDNLLITKDWTIWLIDHTASFRTRRRLEEPASLVRCPRSVLARLRELNRQQLQRTLGEFLSPEQLDALDVRRALLVRHFDDRIASEGEAAILYDLRPK